MDTERRTLYEKENTAGHITYLKLEKELTWTLYLRFATRHFVPCEKCQVAIHKEVESAVYGMSFQNGYQLVEIIVSNVLCKQCRENIAKKIMHSDRIILGNKEYEPLIELQREWDEVPESRVAITSEKYDEGLHVHSR